VRMTRLLTLFASALLVLAACGSDTSSGSSYGATSTTTAAGSTTTAAGATSGTGATVSVAAGGPLGDHLVGPNGHTLYLFEKDQGTETACTGGCVPNWPPLVAVGAPTAGPGVDASALSTAAGIDPNQVTYHGHLLYYFAGDQAPGDANGTSVPSWYAVHPDGSAIEND